MQLLEAAVRAILITLIETQSVARTAAAYIL